MDRDLKNSEALPSLPSLPLVPCDLRGLELGMCKRGATRSEKEASRGAYYMGLESEAKEFDLCH